MIKIATIIGARPQIIKAAALSRCFRNDYKEDVREVIIHTGQHYDENLSKVFFDELNVPEEDYNLNTGSGSHATQTAKIMTGVEEILQKEKPDLVLLYGDTNSTLGAAIAAAKIFIPVVHVEGGVRSFNKSYPEEINRLVADHLSTLVFVPTITGVKNLFREGFNGEAEPPYSIDNARVYYCGDIMYDNSLYFSKIASERSGIRDQLDIRNKNFCLVTLHRPQNVDDPAVLINILNAFDAIGKEKDLQIVFPMHPRTIHSLKKNDPGTDFMRSDGPIQIIPAVSYLDMIELENAATIIATDSGGVQKEAYFFQKPCIIMLDETPWVELVESGTAILTGSDTGKIENAFDVLLNDNVELTYPPLFGDGHAAEFICREIVRFCREDIKK